VFNKYIYSIRNRLYLIAKFVPSVVIRIFIKFYVSIERYRLNKLRTPLSVILYVTNRCNAKCSHCYYWDDLNDKEDYNELQIKDYEKIALSFDSPLNTLLITGGEVFLRKDLFEIIMIFIEKNNTKKIHLCTHGGFSDRAYDVATKIINKHMNIELSIQVSIDGLYDDHDRIRKIPLFDKAIKTVELLAFLGKKHVNFSVNVITTITKENYIQLPEIAEYFKNKFPDVHHGFQFVRSSTNETFNIDTNIVEGYDPENVNKVMMSTSMMQDVIDSSYFNSSLNNLFLNKYIIAMNQGVVEILKNKKKFVNNCVAGKYDAVIYPYGDVSMCEFTTSFDNLKNYSFDFKKLWNSEIADARRKKISSCFCTHTCNIMNSMKYDSDILYSIFSYHDGG